MSLLDSIARVTNPSSIDDLKSVIGKRAGLARQNRFNVIITPPGITLLNQDFGGLLQQSLTGNLGLNDFVNDPRDIALLCESCTMPGKSLTTVDHNFRGYGQSIKYATGYNNEDVTMSFLVTNDYYMVKTFTKWMNSIVDHNNYISKYRKDHSSDIIIQQLDNNNRVAYGVKLLEAYPISVSPITLDNTATDTVQKITVTFTYRDFKQEEGLSSLLSGGKGLFDSVKDIGVQGVVNKTKNAVSSAQNALGTIRNLF